METKQKQNFLIILLVMINIATGIIGFAFGMEESKYNCECETIEIKGPCPNQTRNLTQFEKYVGGSTIEEIKHNSEVTFINN